MATTGIYPRMKKFFRRAYEKGVHGWPSFDPTPELVGFLKTIRTNGAQRALDLGCGEGRHSVAMARMGYDVEAVDLERLALRRARAFARKKRVVSRIRFQTANALALKFPAGTFDVVLDYGCFHHVLKRDWPKYRRNILRVLKPRGHFLLSVFSTEFKHTPDEKRTRNWLVHRDHYDRFFTRNDIRAAFSRTFEIVAIKKENSGLQVLFHVLMRRKLAIIERRVAGACTF